MLPEMMLDAGILEGTNAVARPLKSDTPDREIARVWRKGSPWAGGRIQAAGRGIAGGLGQGNAPPSDSTPIAAQSGLGANDPMSDNDWDQLDRYPANALFGATPAWRSISLEHELKPLIADGVVRWSKLESTSVRKRGFASKLSSVRLSQVRAPNAFDLSALA